MADSPIAPEALVVLVEPNAAAAGFLDQQLTCDGLVCVTVSNAPDALAIADRQSPALMLIGDLGERRDTLELIARVRAGYVGAVDPLVPIVLLSARTGERDVLCAFEAGVDDVIAKPFSYPQLLARLRALLRRAGAGRSRPLLRVGALEIDTAARQVRLAGVPIALRRLEYELLVHLAAAPERVFDKRELLRDVWGFRSPGMTRAVDATALRLRRKLGEAWVLNEWGVGYRLARVSAPAAA